MKRLLLLLLLFPCIVLAQTDPLNSAYKPSAACTQVSGIWVTDTMQKIVQGNSTPGTGCFIQVYATQGEFADFQVHVVAPAGGYAALNIVSSGFTQAAPDSSTPIPAPDATHNNVLVYREGYYNVSPISSSASAYYGATGLYPDPLIPTIDPYYHQTTNAWPFAVAANQTQSAWVDVFVPLTAKSGYYSGTITVSNGATTLATIPVILAVWQWPASQGSHMPTTSTLPSFTQYGFHAFCATVNSTGLYPTYCSNDNTADTDGGVMFMDHRYTMTDPVNASAAQQAMLWGGTTTGVTSAKPIIPGATTTGVNWRAQTGIWSQQGFATQFKSIVYPQGSNGTYPLTTPFYQIGDEPGSGGAGDWNTLCGLAPGSHGTSPATATEASTNITTMNFPSYASQANCTALPGGVQNSLDIMTVNVACMEPASGNACSGGSGGVSPALGLRRADYNAWLAHTNPDGIKPMLWSYISCASTPCGGGAEANPMNYANYVIDGKPASNRVMEWMTYFHQQTGELYYYTDCSFASNGCSGNTNPWTSQYVAGNHGDGNLYYPSNVGATLYVAQPGGAALATPLSLPSVRLKHIRDGMQDWEYMSALNTAGQGSFVTTQIQSWITNSYSYDFTGAGLQSARTAMGNALHQLTFSSFPASGCAQSGSNWFCAAGATTAQIQIAINAAAPNEIIDLQAGNYTQTAAWVIQSKAGTNGAPAVSPGITIQCDTPPPTTGSAFASPCVITTSTPILNADYHAINDNLIRITGLTIVQNASLDHVGSLAFYSGCDSTCFGGFNRIRVDHNTWIMTSATTPGSDVLNMANGGAAGNFYGVMDHNLGCAVGSSTIAPCSNFASIGVGAAPAIQWAFQVGGVNPAFPANQEGTLNAMYLEDNDSEIYLPSGTGGNYDGFTDGWGGLSFVVRNNTIRDQLLVVHGTGGDGGPANYEVYNNSVIFDAGMGGLFAGCYRAIHHQGSGTFMVFNNTFTCPSTPNADLAEMFYYRSSNQNLLDGSPFPYSSFCNGYFNVPPVVDGNRSPTGTNFGYPCWNQPGRDFHGNLYPMYSWNNLANGLVRNIYLNAFNSNAPFPNYSTQHMQFDRDAYDAVSATANTSPTTPWDCATASIANGGMGFGTLANRPTDCAAYTGEVGGGFGYFATDTNILYQFGSTGWVAAYQPLVHPHPLVSGTAIAAMPVMNPASKASLTAITGLTMTSSTPGATIWYTLNNTQPTCGPASSTLFKYTAAINVNSTETINAIACAPGVFQSYTNTSGYAINATLIPPTFSYYPGTYASTAQQLQVLMPPMLPPQAFICWTTDGSIPMGTGGVCGGATTHASTLNGSFGVACASACSSMTVNAIATSAGYNPSPVVTAVYNIPAAGTNSLFLGAGTQSAANFGNQAMGVTSAPQSITLSNVCVFSGGAACSGTTATTITSFTITGPNASDFADDNATGSCNTARTPGATSLPQTLNPQAFCALDITFTPGGSGARTATLNVNYTGANSGTQSIPLIGNSAGTALASLIPPTLSFGNQNINTTSAGLAATFSNTGTVPVTVTQAQVFGTNFTLTNLGTCQGTSFTLQAGQSCTFVITFSPTATTAYTGTFQVTDNASGSPQTINLSGQGTQATIVWLSPQGGTTYNYGSILVNTPTNSANLQLQNTGTGPLNVALTITGANAAQFSINSTTCPNPLPAGNNCQVVVTFTSIAAASYTAFLTETDSLASNSPQNLTLNGTGVTSVPISAPWPVMVISQNRSPKHEISDSSCDVTSLGWYGICADPPSRSFVGSFPHYRSDGL